jgi:hypothetical protein
MNQSHKKQTPQKKGGGDQAATLIPSLNYSRKYKSNWHLN